MYSRKLEQYKDQQYEINTRLEEHTRADENYHITAGTVLNLARHARELFDRSEIPEKRALLNYLLQNGSVSGKKLTFTVRKPFDVVLELANCPTVLRALEAFRTTIWQIPGNISPFKIVNYW